MSKRSVWCWCWCRWGDSALSTGDKATAGYGNELQGARAGRAAVCRDRWSAAVVSCRRRAATAVPCRPLVLSRLALFSHQSPAVVFSIVNYVSPAPRDQNVCSRLPPGSLASLRPYDNRENCSNLPSVFFKIQILIWVGMPFPVTERSAYSPVLLLYWERPRFKIYHYIYRRPVSRITLWISLKPVWNLVGNSVS